MTVAEVSSSSHQSASPVIALEKMFDLLIYWFTLFLFHLFLLSVFWAHWGKEGMGATVQGVYYHTNSL